MEPFAERGRGYKEVPGRKQVPAKAERAGLISQFSVLSKTPRVTD
jgi:hypothetical protein